MQVKDKLALQRFKDLVQRIQSTTGVLAPETHQEKTRRIKRLLANYNDFVEYYFPHYAESKCAWYHLKAARKVKQNASLDAVAEIFRGGAKSTHFNVMIPLWLKAQKDMRVMILVGKNKDNAEVLLSDIQAELLANDRYINDFGIQMRHGSWEEGRFVTQDDCAFFALGRGQSPRGLRHRQHRPDYIVMDDIDDDELSRNPDRVNKMYEWVIRALFFTTDMGRGRFICVGNRISQNSVLAKLADRPGVFHLKVNVLNDQGEPNWPEKYTRKEIESVIARLGYRDAQQELFNNPITAGAVFKREWIQFEKAPNLNHFDALISYCDPSFKNSATSDYKAIVTVGQKGRFYYVVKSFVRKCSIGEMVRWWYNEHELLPQTATCQYYMEANFMQDLILDEFTKEGASKERKGQLPLRADKRKKPDKFARIESMSPLFERGLIKFDQRLEKDADTGRLIEQLMSIEKGSRSHDDAPDALEGALYLLGRSGRKQITNYRFHPRQSRRF